MAPASPRRASASDRSSDCTSGLSSAESTSNRRLVSPMLPTLRLAVCRPAGVAFISLPGISLGGIAAAGAVPGEAMLGGTSGADAWGSEEHKYELQALMRISNAVF